jgi:hypothetical protein
LRFKVIGDLMLVVHADTPPADSDWADMLRERDDHAGTLKGLLVVAPPKASINASQRADVQSYLRQTGARIAVLTDSKLVRGAALAVAWFGVSVRAFPTSGLHAALEYLQGPAEREALVARTIGELNEKLHAPI